MAKIKEIYNYLDIIAPFRTQDGFDNSGLVIGDMGCQKEINTVLIALDATVRVVEEARKMGADMILTHHPVIFHAVKHLDCGYPYALAIKYGIPIICSHTCLDSAENGVSDMMIKILGFENLRRTPYINREDPVTGRKVGYGATAECEKMTGEELAKLCKERFGTAGLRWVDGGREITRVACGSGASSDIMEYAFEQGAQAVVTADVKLDRFIEADRLGMTLIDAGHYETEAIALPYLKSALESEFGLKCVITKSDRVVRGM